MPCSQISGYSVPFPCLLNFSFGGKVAVPVWGHKNIKKLKITRGKFSLN